MKVTDLIEEYSKGFHSIAPDQSVKEAVKAMTGFSVSALMVMENSKTAGIFTERDLLRCHILFPGKNIDSVPVSDVMTPSLIVADPEDTVEEAVGMMIKAKVRHLPVVSEGKISCILCLEDLVKKLVKVLTRELHYLKDYISDLQDAADD